MIPFTVPRKSELFQEDLYPDTQADIPALTADEWWGGSNADPILVPMTEAGVQSKKVDDLFECYRERTSLTFPFHLLHLSQNALIEKGPFARAGGRRISC